MNRRIVAATLAAIRKVTEPRYFRSERGYQGQFYCVLRADLEAKRLIRGGILLEMEHQKARDHHGTRQRPDIVLHVPREESGSGPEENNYAVWALKLEADSDDADEDFRKLDEMFRELRYPLGFFVNINSEYHRLEYYAGTYRERVHAVSAKLIDGSVRGKHAWFGEDGELRIEDV